MDLGLLFITLYSNIYRIFHYVNEYWLCNNKVIAIIFFNNLTDTNGMKQAAEDFAVNSQNEGIFGGIISFLDGWLVNIKCSMLKEDRIKN